MSAPLPASVAVFGPGLLGGSILLALQERQPAIRRVAWARRPEALQPLGTAAHLATTDPLQAAREAELIILCTPIGTMPGLLRSILPALTTHHLVTDVGSVKGPVHEALAPLARDHCLWLGCHPMAGSDKSGFQHARRDLFHGAVTLLTPVKETPPAALDRLTAFWTALGSRIICLTPSEHDQAVAAISHLPHLLAAVLVNSIPDTAASCAGPGFRDVTRIAAGPSEMWTEILLQNRPSVLQALDRFLAETRAARQALEAGDATALRTLLDKACQLRRSLV